jgi:hypothetical protein
MLRIIFTSWTFIALLVSAVTTAMQIEPAIYVIMMIMDSHDTFSVALSVGLTFLILESPILLLATIIVIYYRFKNKLPDTIGKTGISLLRKSKLMDALYVFDVYIDNKLKGKIVNGQTIFIELLSGKHNIKIKSGKRKSNELEVEVHKGEIHKTMVIIIPAVNKTIFPKYSSSFNLYVLTSYS